MKKLLLIFFFATSSFASLPMPEVEKLPNGLEIIWFSEPRFPVIDVLLLNKYGFKNDPQNESGATKLIEKVLEKSSLIYEVENLGGSVSVTGSDEAFSIAVHGLSKDSNQLLSFLHKIVLQPQWDPKEFTKIRSRILDSWKHKAQQPQILSQLGFDRSVLSGSVYARGGISNVKELNQISFEQIRNEYQLRLQPQHSILMVVGKFDQIETRKKIIELFGNWKNAQKSKSSPIRYRSKKFQQNKNEILLVEGASANQAHVSMGFEGPSYLTEDYYELRMANAILGEGFHSRLNQILRNNMALTYGVQSSFEFKKDFTVFEISTSTRVPEIGQLLQAVFKVLKEFQSGKITDEEFENSKRYLIGSFSVQYSNIYSIASRWLSGHLFELKPDFLNLYLSRVQSLKKEEVEKSIRKQFRNKNIKTVISGDALKIKKALNQAGYRKIKILGAKDLDSDVISP